MVKYSAFIVAACVVTTLSNYAANAFNFNQPCKAFTCPAQQKLVFKEKFVYTANGCGTSQLPIMARSDFAECCNWHDACYSTCGMKKSKCEKRMEKCMNEKCVGIKDEEEKDKCTSTAKLFSIGAQMLACPAFQDAQREACKCVKEDEAGDAHRARLKHFLKTNDAPAEEQTDDAIDALLGKYKGQEPTMFLRLLVKYPKAIKVDKSKSNFMEEVFKANPLDAFESTGPKKDKFTVGVKDGEDSDEQDSSKKDTFSVGDVEVDEHIEL
ncbi:TPA: hypothetical protein N0F65_013057 [Lagenidium giganteum]|uniref:Phospholipase A2 n=1 Tax=Lagenidium giganteum TaxID=4803 RepID=A0AAV2YJP6_9STRA|nr:TPA: hypothetical protein N0F65_013057 [Lagenidium giganteum]